jgi:hypothetical protein
MTKIRPARARKSSAGESSPIEDEILQSLRHQSYLGSNSLTTRGNPSTLRDPNFNVSENFVELNLVNECSQLTVWHLRVTNFMRPCLFDCFCLE